MTFLSFSANFKFDHDLYTYGRSCYFKGTGVMDFVSARSYCLLKGFHLIALESEEESQFATDNNLREYHIKCEGIITQ